MASDTTTLFGSILITRLHARRLHRGARRRGRCRSGDCFLQRSVRYATAILAESSLPDAVRGASLRGLRPSPVPTPVARAPTRRCALETARTDGRAGSAKGVDFPAANTTTEPSVQRTAAPLRRRAGHARRTKPRFHTACAFFDARATKARGIKTRAFTFYPTRALYFSGAGQVIGIERARGPARRARRWSCRGLCRRRHRQRSRAICLVIDGVDDDEVERSDQTDFVRSARLVAIDDTANIASAPNSP